MDKKKYIKVTDPEGNFIIGENLGEAVDSIVGPDIEFREVGEKFTLEVVEMTEAEYNALPEFQG